MRLGVLDVGSNTVHLLVVDARQGAPPLPAYSHKVELRLAEHLDEAGEVSEDGAARLVEAVRGAVTVSEDMGCASLLAFATSAIREAANGDRVLELVRERADVELRVLSGDAEARATFLAVRRWYGWSSRRLLVLDIGGGSLEVATGQDEEPDEATSLPLGAGRLTRDRLVGDPPPAEQVRELRKYVRAEIAASAGDLLRLGPADHFVGTSKTFRTLARICGAAPSADGPYVTRAMTRSALGEWLPKLAEMTTDERRELPGVSQARAAQLIAGGVVAEATMDLYDIDRLEICPWALREGVILRHLDTLATEGM